jgi:hypothetical protein
MGSEETRAVSGRRVGRGVVAAAVVALLAAGCSDDDDDGGALTDQPGETTTSASAAGAGDGAADAYCAAETELELLPPPDSSDTAALAAWAGSVAKPAVLEVTQVAQDELTSDLGAVTAALDQLIDTGDSAALSDPGYVEAAARIHEYDLANCGWTRVDVTATEYAFEGIPEELPAGVTSFELTNDGEELHELRVFTAADGADPSLEEVVQTAAGPEEAWTGIIQPAGTGEYTAQGESGYFVAELRPGTYYAICSLPVGATSEDAAPPAGSPLHSMEGMAIQFTVS